MTFYVYRLTDASGATRYIGKGSGHRHKASAKERASEAGEPLESQIIWDGLKEDQAYQRERDMIAMFQPDLNKHPGGNGSRAKPKRKLSDRRFMTKAERRWEAMSGKEQARDLLMRFTGQYVFYYQ